LRPLRLRDKHGQTARGRIRLGPVQP
jgi:hypothetical protein